MADRADRFRLLGDTLLLRVRVHMGDALGVGKLRQLHTIFSIHVNELSVDESEIFFETSITRLSAVLRIACKRKRCCHVLKGWTG